MSRKSRLWRVWETGWHDNVRDEKKWAKKYHCWRYQRQIRSLRIIDTKRTTEYCKEWIAFLDLVIHNTETTPSFARGECTSHIDVTLSIKPIARKMQNWRTGTSENMRSWNTVISNYIQKIRGVGRKETIDWTLYKAGRYFRLFMFQCEKLKTS